MGRNSNRVLVLGALGVVAGWGCSPNALRQPVEIPLNASQSTFEVTADTPTRQSGSYSFNPSVTVGSGSLELDPDAITFTPADTGGGKSRVTLQGGESQIVVTVWVDGPDELATVCETGDEYGAFTVELVDNTPVSVSPNTVELKDKTIDLLNDGLFSLCIEVTSDLDGTVTIEQINMNLGL